MIRILLAEDEQAMREYLARLHIDNRLKRVTKFERQVIAASAVRAIGVGQAIVT